MTIQPSPALLQDPSPSSGPDTELSSLPPEPHITLVKCFANAYLCFAYVKIRQHQPRPSSSSGPDGPFFVVADNASSRLAADTDNSYENDDDDEHDDEYFFS